MSTVSISTFKSFNIVSDFYFVNYCSLYIMTCYDMHQIVVTSMIQIKNMNIYESTEAPPPLPPLGNQNKTKSFYNIML